MVFFRYIPWLLQSLFGLLLVCWPLLDTGPGGATTPLRLGLACTTTGLFAAALLATGRPQLPFRFHLVDRAAALCAGWFLLHTLLFSPRETDPYCLLNGWTILTAYGFCRTTGTAFLLPSLLLSGVVQSGIALAQTTGRLASRHLYYDFTGSFPNPGPLGGWLCAATLAALLLALKAGKNGRRILCAGYAAAGGCTGIALWLTDSRAAWVGFAAGIVCLLALSKFNRKRTVVLLSVIAGCVGTGWLYGYKKGSADGRLLIWRVSADLIARKPLVGNGLGTFPELYMPAQAAYFERHPDSRFAEVAEQVNHPFNEWIGTVCESGAIGGGLMLLLIGAAFAGRGDPTGKVLLAGLLLFGMFSYPSAFPVFGLLFAAVLTRCAEQHGTLSAEKPRPTPARCGWSTAVLLGGAVLLAGLCRSGASRRNRYVLLQEVSRAMHRERATDPNVLSEIERSARRLPVAELYTDLGDRWLDADSIERAKRCYRLAARMIPRRLRPYEGLWRACRRAGETDSALILARKIVSMPVKASNTTTIRIRRAAQKWIDETESDSPEVRGCTGG